MKLHIEDRFDEERGCGFRKEGGLYFISGNFLAPCQNLPVQLVVCPVCHSGIKFSRGFTWIDIDALILDKIKNDGIGCQNPYCANCPANGHFGEKVGLIWIGEQFYRTPESFIREAAGQGISRRISAIPNNFKIGESFIALAHRKAIRAGGEYHPGLFMVFKPDAIEYVVKHDEKGNVADDEKKLQSLISRGVTLVRVSRISYEFPINE